LYTMKKTITFLSICMLTIAGTQSSWAQTKEETVNYINDLYIRSYNFEGDKIGSVKMDTYYKNSLAIKQSWKTDYIDLMSFEVEDLKIVKSSNDDLYFVNAKNKPVFSFLSSKDDAESLKSSLEH